MTKFVAIFADGSTFKRTMKHDPIDIGFEAEVLKLVVKALAKFGPKGVAISTISFVQDVL